MEGAGRVGDPEIGNGNSLKILLYNDTPCQSLEVCMEVYLKTRL